MGKKGCLPQKILVLSVTILALVGLGISSPQGLLAQGDEVNLSLSPAQGTYQVGEDFSVGVNLNSAGQKIVGADAKLEFNPALVTATDVKGSSDKFSYITKIDNEKGTVWVTAIIQDLFSDGTAWDGELATVSFKGGSAGTANVNLVFDATDKEPDSSVALLGGSGDILVAVHSASYNIVGGGEDNSVGVYEGTPTPTSVSTLTPVPTVRPTDVPSAVSTNTPTPTVAQLPETGVVEVTYLVVALAAVLIIVGYKLALL